LGAAEKFCPDSVVAAASAGRDEAPQRDAGYLGQAGAMLHAWCSAAGRDFRWVAAVEREPSVAKSMLLRPREPDFQVPHLSDEAPEVAAASQMLAE